MARHHKKIRMKKGTRRTVVATLVLSFAVFFCLLHYGKRESFFEREPATVGELSIPALHESFERQGISGFRRQKEILKANVSWGIEKNDPKAEPIAVYLFPELLPDEHFEKQAALDGWTPLERDIESRPGTEEARQSFEELRAQIWIYENPDSKSPALTDTASEVVKLYDRISQKQ